MGSREWEIGAVRRKGLPNGLGQWRFVLLHESVRLQFAKAC